MKLCKCGQAQWQQHHLYLNIVYCAICGIEYHISDLIAFYLIESPICKTISDITFRYGGQISPSAIRNFCTDFDRTKIVPVSDHGKAIIWAYNRHLREVRKF